MLGAERPSKLDQARLYRFDLMVTAANACLDSAEHAALFSRTDDAIRHFSAARQNQEAVDWPPVSTAVRGTSVAHWLRLLPEACAATNAFPCTSGGTRSKSFPEAGFSGFTPALCNLPDSPQLLTRTLAEAVQRCLHRHCSPCSTALVREPSRSTTVATTDLSKRSKSAKTIDAEVGSAYATASVFLCSEFRLTCYRQVIARTNTCAVPCSGQLAAGPLPLLPQRPHRFSQALNAQRKHAVVGKFADVLG